MNFSTPKLVETHVFRPRSRRPPFSDPLNWTDYRWDAGPWHGGRPQASWAPFSPGRGRSGWLGLLLAGLALVVGAQLFKSFQSRNGSWARRGLYAVALIMIASAFSRHRRRW